MKNLIRIFMLCWLPVAVALAQSSTAVPVNQLAVPATAATGSWLITIQDGIFKIVPYIAPVSTGTPVDGETYNFAAAPPAPTIALKNTPIAGSPHVYRNGVRLSINEDFTVAGAVLTFSGQNMPAAGDKFVIDYRY